MSAEVMKYQTSQSNSVTGCDCIVYNYTHGIIGCTVHTVHELHAVCAVYLYNAHNTRSIHSTHTI